jgi:DNA-binding CsgD family transcriptional regulator
MSVDILSFERSLNQLTLIEGADALFKQLNALGFNTCSFIAVPSNLSEVLVTRAWACTQFTPRIESLYRNRLSSYDPILKYFKEGNRSPFLWSRHQFLGREKLITNLLKFWGANNGLVVPYFCRNITGALCTCAEGDYNSHDNLLSLQGASMIALGHTYSQHIDANGAIDEIYKSQGLSKRDVTYLKLKGDGLMDKQAADKLNVTLDGISYYKRQIKKKLGIRDISEAAIHYNKLESLSV